MKEKYSRERLHVDFRAKKKHFTEERRRHSSV